MTTERPERRARNVALIGLAFQVVLTAFFAIVAAWTQSEAIRGITLLSSAGVIVWFYLTLVAHQRVLVQDEALETEHLRREQQAGLASGTIFEVDQEQLLLARRRLHWMYRWLLPACTIAVVIALVAMERWSYGWRLGVSIRSPNWPGISTDASRLAIWFLGGAAFVSFLLSRYVTGMARHPEWRMLRAGAGWLMGITLASVAAAATLAPLHYQGSPVAEHVLSYVLRLLLLVLAIEIIFNFVLDFYRPRLPDEEPRPAFDSRLLGLFSEPGGIARSIADAINYQFGFEVSSTWFYKLMERAALPLICFAVLMLLAATCLVIVDADEQAVIERFGKPLRVEEPGLHTKWPWPLEMAHKVGIKQVHELRIGQKSETVGAQPQNQLILWTNKHEDEPHLNVLIATPKLAEFITATQPAGSTSRPAMTPGATASSQPASLARIDLGDPAKAVPVSILRVAMTVQYRIKDALHWVQTYHDPEGMLRAVASQELTRIFANVDVEGVLSSQRAEMEESLQDQLQRMADDRDLGVEIVFLGLSVHPPEETAQAFQDVIGAVQKARATIGEAELEKNKRLSQVAGSRALAEDLYEQVMLANDPAQPEDVRQGAARQVRLLFSGDPNRRQPPIGGEAAGQMARARADRWRLENNAHGQAALFTEAMAVKNAAPGVFQLRTQLNSLAAAVGKIRKYVIAVEGEVKVESYNLNLQDTPKAIDFGGK